MLLSIQPEQKNAIHCSVFIIVAVMGECESRESRPIIEATVNYCGVQTSTVACLDDNSFQFRLTSQLSCPYDPPVMAVAQRSY